MKHTIIIFLALSLFSCKQEPKEDAQIEDQNSITTETTVRETTVTTDTISEEDNTVRKFSNDRFRQVQVTKTGNGKYMVQGEGQIFEASFNWVVEDGHDELLDGFATTDAGAPEWGSFSFTINVEKARPNSTLNLILFESSAKDGSRQHELAIPLRD